MVITSDEQTLQGIGQLLVFEQFLEKQKAIEYCKHANLEQISLIKYIVKNNILTAREIALTAATNFGIPLMDIHCMDIESFPIHLVNEQLIHCHQMVPLFIRGNNLYLATDDPGKQTSLKDIQFHTGFTTNAIVVETDKLSLIIEQILNKKEKLSLVRFSEGFNETDHFNMDDGPYILNNSEVLADDAPIVAYVNKILLQALKQSASDIHFELYEQEYRIRFRQDGILHWVANPPASLSSRITSRIKVMSNLDISEKRVPQDGGFKFKLSPTRAIDFRVNTCPTATGEKVALRILDPLAAKPNVEDLGFSSDQKACFTKAIRRPQGMILVTGPTGSGKTLTLYTALNLLNTMEVNISTAEDPVEIKVSGINQVNINPRAGLTFSTALRAFLRQDPDIIMVGEMRDFETAEIAIKAAQTGHLVLSTLHTNSAAETLHRLVSMGIPAFNIASSITLIISQRLVRKLCEYCKTVRDDFTEQGLLESGFKQTDIKDNRLFKAVGCNRCTNGYKGRVGLFELLPMTKGLGQLILSGGTALDILKLAQSEGVLTMYQSGLEKVKQGITSLEEVNRVTVD